MQITDYDVTVYLDDDVTPYSREFTLFDSKKSDERLTRTLFVHLQLRPVFTYPGKVRKAV